MKTQKTVKDYLARSDIDAFQRAEIFQEFIQQMNNEKYNGYGIKSYNGTNARMCIADLYSNQKIETISFVGNDYLGLSQHPETIIAGINGIKKYGTGSCASPLIGGFLDIHDKLEKKLAETFEFEAAMIYPTGYATNSGSIATLLSNKDIALVDMYVHSSVYDGLHQTNVKILPHNNIEYLERTLKNYKDKYVTKLVIIDGLYSQDGDISPIPEILNVCRRNGAYLMVDDAHGIGVFGENGKGVLEHYNLLGKIDILTGTFSKSFGAVGGFIASNKKIIDYLKYNSRASLFSAAPIPQSAASVYKAIDIVINDKKRREKLWDNVRYFHNTLRELSFDIGKTMSPIVPIMIRDDHKAKKAARLLLELGVYTIPILYPGVKKGDSRLRVTLTSEHSRKNLEYFVNCLLKIDKILSIRNLL